MLARCFPVVAPDPLRVATTLPCDTSAPGSARRLVIDGCASVGMDADVVDTAELLVSEVVTNAVIHGRSEVRLWVMASEVAVRVEVGDDNSRHPVALRSEEGALDGRGMAIVEMLASAWGVQDGAFGKIVWFEVTT